MVEIPESAKAQLKDQAGGLSAEHIRDVFERYTALFSAADADGVAALYAEDAVLRDPVTSPPVQGRQNIRNWYQAAFDGMEAGMVLELEGAVRIAGNLGAAAMLVRTANNGQPLLVETLDVMRFDDDGLIAAMDAYFGPSNYRPG